MAADRLPDPRDYGGEPYTPDEIALGYGTDHDPRFPVSAAVSPAACPKCGTPGAANVTHFCMTAGEVPDPPAMRWLNPPADRGLHRMESSGFDYERGLPVEVVPVSAAVSPADTPTGDRWHGLYTGTANDQAMVNRAALTALLAENERLLAEGERDRRQIARLTEALNEARPIVASVAYEFDAPADSKVLEQIDAVLADEEDAQP